MDSPVVDDDKLHYTSADNSINTGINASGDVMQAFESCKGRQGLTPFGKFPCHALIELAQNEVTQTDQKFGFADELPRESRFRRFSRAYWNFSNSFRSD